MAEQYITAVVFGRVGLFPSWWQGNKERGKRRDQGPNIPFKGMLPMT
jgi:hypothetical protein